MLVIFINNAIMPVITETLTLPTAKVVYEINKLEKLARISYLPKAKNPRNKIYAQSSVCSISKARDQYQATKAKVKSKAAWHLTPASFIEVGVF